MSLKCISCKKMLISEDDFAKFACPKCGKATIVRCQNCRRQVILYKCPDCSFEGP